jgi:hydrogenase maturation protein HypF
MPTFHLHIKGLVQGVGFRPLVYLLAKGLGLCGWVNNAADGVHIVVNASAKEAKLLLDRLLQHPPALAVITEHILEETSWEDFQDFQIRHSDEGYSAGLMIPPDFGLCAQCASELADPDNRRFRYPFITCIQCGPRYAILRRLPFDRVNTTMQDFVMCPSCEQEYNDPADRRYYAQTNSCQACGISLYWQGLPDDKAMDKAAQAIADGQLVAVKGIGGYLLFCDARNAAAIQALRSRKHRPSKPFAVMYPNLRQLQADTLLSESAAKLLASATAPVTITGLRAEHSLSTTIASITPGMQTIGVLLPYAPLYKLLLDTLDRPLIATSANISGSPIGFRDDQKIPEADAILSHNRPIHVPQDDSVIRYSPLLDKPIILRRARGLAPSFRESGLNLRTDSVLAMGAMMKSTFSIVHEQQVYVSQYLGDVSDYETALHYRYCLDYLLELLSCRPDRILVDCHPDYPTTQLGQELAGHWQIPVLQYQHHEAHFAAVLAENQLLAQEEPVLGVIWDGTGLGTDGQIWGGDMFSFRAGSIRRLTHVRYFPVIAGDKMSREPRLSALALCHEDPLLLSQMKPLFSDTEWQVYQALLAGNALIQSASMGRVFDAVAALLGVLYRSDYEGQAAMLLEQLALGVFRHTGTGSVRPLSVCMDEDGQLDAAATLSAIGAELRKGADLAMLAARFHMTLVDWIDTIARETGHEHIAFSGGVFQNGLLCDLIRQQLGDRYRLYFHRQLSPNDENISFGQSVLYQISGSDRA